ncbi:uncharacterized protein LOC119684698 [Teleopsis dalmanni]|uniref:uncharacterized protein LOC119684670 n=1 Tax=Teleopsis dalmanni TaxID=139649 RepID=UPI0018CF7AC1|nr:uncharacterized protein LOC119684670 [Teleopsis dalmanni]XP_037954727.1 uncharacterized protein LOC119684698 [Teleopsis dalmanni]
MFLNSTMKTTEELSYSELVANMSSFNSADFSMYINSSEAIDNKKRLRTEKRESIPITLEAAKKCEEIDDDNDDDNEFISTSDTSSSKECTLNTTESLNNLLEYFDEELLFNPNTTTTANTTITDKVATLIAKFRCKTVQVSLRKKSTKLNRRQSVVRLNIKELRRRYETNNADKLNKSSTQQKSSRSRVKQIVQMFNAKMVQIIRRNGNETPYTTLHNQLSPETKTTTENINKFVQQVSAPTSHTEFITNNTSTTIIPQQPQKRFTNTTCLVTEEIFNQLSVKDKALHFNKFIDNSKFIKQVGPQLTNEQHFVKDLTEELEALCSFPKATINPVKNSPKKLTTDDMKEVPECANLNEKLHNKRDVIPLDIIEATQKRSSNSMLSDDPKKIRLQQVHSNSLRAITPINNINKSIITVFDHEVTISSLDDDAQKSAVNKLLEEALADLTTIDVKESTELVLQTPKKTLRKKKRPAPPIPISNKVLNSSECSSQLQEPCDEPKQNILNPIEDFKFAVPIKPPPRKKRMSRAAPSTDVSDEARSSSECAAQSQDTSDEPKQIISNPSEDFKYAVPIKPPPRKKRLNRAAPSTDVSDEARSSSECAAQSQDTSDEPKQIISNPSEDFKYAVPIKPPPRKKRLNRAAPSTDVSDEARSSSECASQSQATNDEAEHPNKNIPNSSEEFKFAIPIKPAPRKKKMNRILTSGKENLNIEYYKRGKAFKSRPDRKIYNINKENLAQYHASSPNETNIIESRSSPTPISTKSRRRFFYDNDSRRSSVYQQVIQEHHPLDNAKEIPSKQDNFSGRPSANSFANIPSNNLYTKSTFWITVDDLKVSYDICYKPAADLRCAFNSFTQKMRYPTEFGIDEHKFSILDSPTKQERLPKINKIYGHSSYWFSCGDLIIMFTGKQRSTDEVAHLFTFLRKSYTNTSSIRFGVDDIEFSVSQYYRPSGLRFSVDYDMLVGLQAGNSNGLEGRSKFAWPNCRRSSTNLKNPRISDLYRPEFESEKFENSNMPTLSFGNRLSMNFLRYSDASMFSPDMFSLKSEPLDQIFNDVKNLTFLENIVKENNNV